MCMEKTSNQNKQLGKAMKAAIQANMADMSKGFKPVTPHVYGMHIGSPRPDMNYPEFRLKLKDIPEAKSWAVGERYTVELVVEQTGMTDRVGSEAQVEFSIIGIKAGSHVPKSDKAKKAEAKVESAEQEEVEYDDD